MFQTLTPSQQSACSGKSNRPLAMTTQLLAPSAKFCVFMQANKARFEVLNHTDLANVLPDQHHSRQHDVASQATILLLEHPCSMYSVFPGSPNVVGWLTPSLRQQAPHYCARIIRRLNTQRTENWKRNYTF